MSRIGLKPVTVPEGVEIKISASNLVETKGKLGELSLQVDPDIVLKQEDGEISLVRPTEQKRHKAMHGLYRSLISNMIEGVSNGYTIELELVGVGYKAEAKGDILEMNVGFSHDIHIQMPEGVKISAVTEKGKNPQVKLESFDKQLVGAVAAKIRSLRKPEPYKGKGIRYKGEHIRRKAGKSAAKK